MLLWISYHLIPCNDSIMLIEGIQTFFISVGLFVWRQLITNWSMMG